MLHPLVQRLEIGRPDIEAAGQVVHRFKGDAGRIQDLVQGLLALHQAADALLSCEEGALPVQVDPDIPEPPRAEILRRPEDVLFPHLRRDLGELHQLVDGRREVPRDRRPHQDVHRLAHGVEGVSRDVVLDGPVHLGLLSRQDVRIVLQLGHIPTELPQFLGFSVEELVDARVTFLGGEVFVLLQRLIFLLDALGAVPGPDLVFQHPELLDVVGVVKHLREIVDVAVKALHRVGLGVDPLPFLEKGVVLLPGLEVPRPPRDLRGDPRHLFAKAQAVKDPRLFLDAVRLHVRSIVFDEADLLVPVRREEVVDGVVIVGIFLPHGVHRLLHQRPVHPAFGVFDVGFPVQDPEHQLIFPVGELFREAQLLQLAVGPADPPRLVPHRRVKKLLVDPGPRLPAKGAEIVPPPGVRPQRGPHRRLGLAQYLVREMFFDPHPQVLSRLADVVPERDAAVAVPLHPVESRQLLHHMLPVPRLMHGEAVVLQLLVPGRHRLGPADLQRGCLLFPDIVRDLSLHLPALPVCVPHPLHVPEVRDGRFHLDPQLCRGLRAHIAGGHGHVPAVLRPRPPVLPRGVGLRTAILYLAADDLIITKGDEGGSRSFIAVGVDDPVIPFSAQ